MTWLNLMSIVQKETGVALFKNIKKKKKKNFRHFITL